MTTLRVEQIDEREHLEAEREAGQEDERGLGALRTDRGNLPLESIDVQARITGLVSRIELTQGFHNPHDEPLEATYIFPLPDRAAVTAMTLTAADRTVTAQLKERAEARAEYDRAIAAGQRAAIAEEERPDVFTMRVGNILPGERVTVSLTLVGPLSYEDGEATFRLPLVVAPRYIPGTPIGSTVGDGYAPDTDAVPDASRITPPVLLPGFPNPVRLSIGVDIDPAGLPLATVRSTLHAVQREGNHIEIQPGERVNRDFILRLSYGEPAEGQERPAGEPAATAQALVLTRDDAGPDGPNGAEGTFRLTILPPASAAPPKPRDVVLVLDRSGSMSGWKMVAARRAACRIVDTLTTADRFAVIAFDDRVEHPTRPGRGLHPATDRNRYAAVEFLSRMDSRGGTELLAPLTEALGLLSAGTGDTARDRVVVLVTDGQVGNEDQILAHTGAKLAGIRVHTVGIDRAVNAGFLGRLAALGGGRCELVESEDRLDEAMEHIHRRIGAPVVTGLRLSVEGLEILPDTVSPRPVAGVDATTVPLPDLFPGAPLVVTGRYRASTTDAGATDAGASDAGSSVTAVVTGRTRPGDAWTVRVPGVTVRDHTLTSVWARAHLRDLEDRYASLPYGMGGDDLERTIVATSLRYGVLCRFTAWVAVDERVVTEGGQPHRVVQPVELPSGWEMPVAPPMMLAAAPMPAPAASAPMAATPMEGFAQPTAAPRGIPLFRRGRGLAGRAPKRAEAVEPRTGGVAPPWSPMEAEIGPAPAGVPDAVREVAAQEARRLRAAAGAPEYERRELLADLGTRLAALTVDLGGRPAAQAVRSLVAELAEDRLAGVSGAELAQLWDRALALLDALAAGTDPAAGPGSAAGSGPAGTDPAPRPGPRGSRPVVKR
ncbi:MAG: VWA domain-containing protein, partial [Micromonosporaceae bacterium]|nr:VWA domain-containing protein [Micromonosporaceae bacterium]